MSQTLSIQVNEDYPDARTIAKFPEKALRALISQQSQGIFNKELLHSVITTVMKTNDNKLKRMLYYYFETIIDDASFVMCVNQINKDLSSPNEFVRGFALKLAAKFEKFDYVNKQAIDENLTHKHYYVRLNALKCYSELAVRFDWDIETTLVNLLQNETNTKVQSYIFMCMYKMNYAFDEYINNYESADVLDFLVEKVNDSQFLHKCLKCPENKIVFKALCRLLENGEKINISKLIEICAANSIYKKDLERFIPYLKNHTISFLHLIDPYEFDFSFALIDYVIKIVRTQYVLKVSEILYEKYKTITCNSEQRKAFKCGLLTKISTFTNDHCVYEEHMVDSILIDITSEEDPEILYSMVKFLHAVESNKLACSKDIKVNLVNLLNTLKFGKIIRFVLNTIFMNIDQRNFEFLLSALLDNFNRTDEIFYLTEKPEIYLGGYISFIIVKMFKKIQFKDEEEKKQFKAKTAAVCIKFVKHGKKFNLIDQSTISSINLYLRYLMDNSRELLEEKYVQSVLKHENTLSPIEIPLFNTFQKPKKFSVAENDDVKVKTIQLSGLGDPLYVECNLSYTKFECVLDLLIINQTEFYLPEFSIDFSCSKHLKLADTVYPNGIQPSSALTQKISFQILESANSFISPALSFRYPKNGEYLLKPYVQHLGEIELDISDFLEKGDIRDIEFTTMWKELEWENIYSLHAHIENMDECLNLLTTATNGTLVNKESVYDFVVGNFTCFTNQKTVVLVNVSLSENKNVEIRVRSKDEFVVKSISNLLGNVLKKNLVK